MSDLSGKKTGLRTEFEEGIEKDESQRKKEPFAV